MAHKKLEDYLYYSEKDPDIKIYCGNSIEIMPLLQPVDLIITDPPYGLNYQSARPTEERKKEKIENDGFDDYRKLLIDIKNSLDEIMADNAEAYIFCGGGSSSPILAHAWLEYKTAKRFDVKNLLVWDKKFVGMGWDWRFQYETIFQLQTGNGLNNSTDGSTRSNILRCNNVIPQAGDHPTEKPVTLITQILLAKSSQIVLDPFLGSGTTLVACKDLNRKGVGIELTEKYCELAKKRLKNTTKSLF